MNNVRLICGWLWENFFTACIQSTIPINQDNHIWISAIVKCVTALFAIILGARLELYYGTTPSNADNDETIGNNEDNKDVNKDIIDFDTNSNPNASNKPITWRHYPSISDFSTIENEKSSSHPSNDGLISLLLK